MSLISSLITILTPKEFLPSKFLTLEVKQTQSLIYLYWIKALRLSEIIIGPKQASLSARILVIILNLHLTKQTG